MDGKHASFVTGRHGASAPIDVQHWSQFPSFRRLALSDEGLRQEGVVVHDVERFIYMRWKETFFLSSPAEVPRHVSRPRVTNP